VRPDWLDAMVLGVADGAGHITPVEIDSEARADIHEIERYLMTDGVNADVDFLRRIGGAFLLLWRKKLLENESEVDGDECVDLMLRCLDTALVWEFG
jgi:hypothetical protein